MIIITVIEISNDRQTPYEIIEQKAGRTMTQTQTIAKKVRKHLQFTSIIIYFDIKHDFLREKKTNVLLK